VGYGDFSPDDSSASEGFSASPQAGGAYGGYGGGGGGGAYGGYAGSGGYGGYAGGDGFGRAEAKGVHGDEDDGYGYCARPAADAKAGEGLGAGRFAGAKAVASGAKAAHY